MTFDEVYIEHAIAAFDKQVYLSAMHGSHHWELRLDLGRIAYLGPHNHRQEYQVEVLGTESETEHTWLWAWANPEMFSDTAFLRSAHALKKYGETHGLGELTVPVLPITYYVTGARIAAMTSGICRAAAYVRCAYPQGAAYMLIRDPHFKRPVQRPLTRISRILPMFVSDERQLPGRDYQTAFEHYLRFYRLGPAIRVTPDMHTFYTLQPTQREHTLMGEGLQIGENKPLVVEFDAARQLVQIGF